MGKQRNIDDLIHLRAIEFGIKYPNGFMYEDIRKHYEKRGREWVIVDEFLNEAWNNKNGSVVRLTPYVLLEKLGNGNADQCRYTLSFEAYFSYLQYSNAKNARFWSIVGIGVALLLGLISIGISVSQYNGSAVWYSTTIIV
jgi:hypothetical protein